MLDDVSVTALTLHGSATPGSFSILEHVVNFKLKAHPPPEVMQHLPEGSKPGDSLAMVNIGVHWWDEEGKIARELEYGRITWKGFSLDPFDAAK